MTDQIMDDDLAAAEGYNSAVAAGTAPSGKRHVDLNVFRPARELTPNSLDFRRGLLREMEAAGYEDAIWGT